MSLLPPEPKGIGDVWVDPITAERFEWDGADWRAIGQNADLWEAERTKPNELWGSE